MTPFSRFYTSLFSILGAAFLLNQAVCTIFLVCKLAETRLSIVDRLCNSAKSFHVNVREFQCYKELTHKAFDCVNESYSLASCLTFHQVFQHMHEILQPHL